jgi:hypothetical protein
MIILCLVDIALKVKNDDCAAFDAKGNKDITIPELTFWSVIIYR